RRAPAQSPAAETFLLLARTQVLHTRSDYQRRKHCGRAAVALDATVVTIATVVAGAPIAATRARQRDRGVSGGAGASPARPTRSGARRAVPGSRRRPPGCTAAP